MPLADAPNRGQTAPLDNLIFSLFPDLDGWRGHVCGDPALVNKLTKNLFLAGIASNTIYADSFLPAGASAGQSSLAQRGELKRNR